MHSRLQTTRRGSAPSPDARRDCSLPAAAPVSALALVRADAEHARPSGWSVMGVCAA
ncbi:hypothetical protein [Megalodesulfovibrio paquesii]